MMTYAKNYTPASIVLAGKAKGGQTYLNLMFNYGYVEHTATGKVYKPVKLSTGKSVPSDYWVDGDFSEAFRKKHKADWSAMTVEIEKQRQRLFSTYTDLVERLGVKPTPDQIVDAIKGKQAQAERILLVDHIRAYAANDAICKSPRSKAKYITIAHVVEVLEAARQVMPFKKWAQGSGRIYLNTFDDRDWNDFQTLMTKAACPLTETFRREGVEGLVFTNGDGKRTAFYNQTTVQKYQANLSATLNRAIKQKKALGVDPKTLEKVSKTSDKKEYLKADEIALLINGRMKQPYLEDTRKRFVVQLMVGCRVGDLETVLNKPIQTVKGDSMNFKTITFVTAKTGTVVCAPLFKPALDILESPDKPKMISDQRYNEYVKEVCRLLGLDRLTHVVNRKIDGTVLEEHVPIWQEVSSHSARRSLKTLLEGPPMFCSRQLVSQMQGHTINDNSADRVYYSLDNQGAAEALLQQVSLNAHKLPFQIMPNPVTITKAA